MRQEMESEISRKTRTREEVCLISFLGNQESQENCEEFKTKNIKGCEDEHVSGFYNIANIWGVLSFISV